MADSPLPPALSGLTVGTVIGGRYLVESLLGRGGYGTVFRARHTGTGQGVAIKVLQSGLDPDDVLVKRFLQEARITAGLRHPNTIRVFDVGREYENGLLYIAMELLTGKTLKQALVTRLKKDQVFEQEEAIKISIDITRSLSEAHAAGLVHRDLKPDNIFLHEVPGDDEPIVKVLDFGIVKLADSTLTQSSDSGMPGTPAYMSPEQVLQSEVDSRSDLYSLGIVLFALVSGEVPFLGQSAVGTLYKHVHQAIPDVRTAAKTHITDEFAELITRALAKDPDHRHQSAKEFRQALEDCRSGARRAPASPIPAAKTDVDEHDTRPDLPKYEPPPKPRVLAGGFGGLMRPRPEQLGDVPDLSLTPTDLPAVEPPPKPAVVEAPKPAPLGEVPGIRPADPAEAARGAAGGGMLVMGGHGEAAHKVEAPAPVAPAPAPAAKSKTQLFKCPRCSIGQVPGVKSCAYCGLVFDTADVNAALAANAARARKVAARRAAPKGPNISLQIGTPQLSPKGAAGTGTSFWASIPEALIMPLVGSGAMHLPLFVAMLIPAVVLRGPAAAAVELAFVGFVASYFGRAVGRGIDGEPRAPKLMWPRSFIGELVLPGVIIVILTCLIWAPSVYLASKLVIETDPYRFAALRIERDQVETLLPWEVFKDKNGVIVTPSKDDPPSILLRSDGRWVKVFARDEYLVPMPEGWRPGDPEGFEATSMEEVWKGANPPHHKGALIVLLMGFALFYWPMALTVGAVGSSLFQAFNPIAVLGAALRTIGPYSIVVLIGSGLFAVTLVALWATPVYVAGPVSLFTLGYSSGIQGYLMGRIVDSQPRAFPGLYV